MKASGSFSPLFRKECRWEYAAATRTNYVTYMWRVLFIVEVWELISQAVPTLSRIVFFFLRNTCNLCSLNVCGLGWVFLTNSEWISSDLREELPRCLLCIVSYRKALLRVCYVTVTTQSRRERLVWFLTCWEKTLFLSASRFYVCLKNICCWITMARRQLCTHKICPRELW